MAMAKIGNFDDWIDLFKFWQDDIGLQVSELKTYKFEVKLGELEVPEIEFGHYKGQRKWPTLMHIPDQRIRDALQNLIVFQGDTEFASVEQQRSLLQNAPSRLRSAVDLPRDGGGDAPRLADVVSARGALRRRGKARGGEAARAPRR